jgi:hypothetical protein
MAITVIRYSERPELWEDTDAVSQAVWPEYNHHGEVLNRYWGRLFEDFPEFQFVLYDDRDGVLTEGHTVPCVWDGATEGLGNGIDAMIEGAFEARGAGRRPTALGVLAAEIKPEFQGRRLPPQTIGKVPGVSYAVTGQAAGSYDWKGGIYLTQVACECAADRQGLPGLLRGAADVVPRRGCLPRLP